MIVFIIMTYLFIGMCTCIGCLLYDYQLSSAKNIDEYLDWKDIEDLSQYIVMGIVWPIVVLFFLFVILNNIWKHILCLIYLHSIKRIIKKINKNIVNLKKKGEKNE